MKIRKSIVVLIFLLVLTPWVAFAVESPPTPTAPAGVPCDSNSVNSAVLCNALTGSSPFNPDFSVTDLKSFVEFVIVAYTFFIALFTIAMLVFSGFAMIVSQGKPESVERAKRAFSWTIYGFVLTLLSFAIVAAMGAFLGATALPDPSAPPPETDGVVNALADPQLLSVIAKMLNNFLAVAGIIAVLMIIINGLKYLTARGNEEQVQGARQGLTWAAIGLVVIILAFVIIQATATFVGG